MVQNYKKDKNLCGTNSFTLVKDCLLSDNLSQKDRLQKAKDICEDDYWVEYIQNYWDENLSQSDPLAHEQQVHLNLESLATYILFASDGERMNKKTEYNIYKNEEEFMKSCFKHDNFDDLSSEGRLDFLLKDVQYIKDKTIVYKESMLKEEVCKEYSKMLKFLEEKSNIYKLKENLNKKVEFYEKVKKSKIEELNNEKSELNKQQLLLDILDCNIEISNTRFKLKTIMYYFKSLNKIIKEDIVASYISLKQPIYFKHVNYYHYIPETLNFFDKFDVIEDLFDLDKLSMVCKVGYSKRIYNHLDDILTNKAVYENDEAMDILCEQINYYLSKIIDNESIEEVFNLFREGKNYTEIANITSKHRNTISSIVLKVLEQIVKVHEENLQDWYYLNIIRDKEEQVVKQELKYCIKCGIEKSLDEFSDDSRNKDNKKSWCKKCVNLDIQLKRAGII